MRDPNPVDAVPEDLAEAGVPASDSGTTAPLAGIQRELVSSHFLLLSRLLRRGARADYAEMEPSNLVERRLTLTLYRIEEARVSELAGLLGNDVAQISRALGAMRRAKLVGRDRQRDPYRLTEEGMRLGEALDQVAVRRESELASGFGPREMFELAGLLSNLLAKASAILTDEAAHARDGGDERAESAPITVPAIHDRLQPAILNLSTIIARGATVAFKRLAGLSHYEWRLLANVAARPHISFMELVALIDSDKAQVSRALDAMAGGALLERSGGQGRQAVRFTLSQEGYRVYEIMRADALRRNAILLADLNPGQRRRMRSYAERLIANVAEPAATT